MTLNERIIEGPCWEWPGTVTELGYGRRKVRGKNVFAHRAIFEATIRTIPEGLVLDHLCRNRRCVNPFHLEAVSNRENVLRGVGLSANNYRKTKCHKGHPLYGENVVVNSQGARVCLACRSIIQKRYRESHGK